MVLSGNEEYPVTIKDIARALNISISAVYRAFRGLPEIHPDTRNAVIKLAEKLDYQPNQLDKNLAKSRTKPLGVIVPYFFPAMLNSIEKAVLQAGCSVLVCQTNESYLREITNIQNLLRSQIEGFISSLLRDDSPAPKETKAINTQLIIRASSLRPVGVVACRCSRW